MGLAVLVLGYAFGCFPNQVTFQVLRGDSRNLCIAANMRRPVLKNILVTTDRSLAESLRARPAEGGVRLSKRAFGLMTTFASTTMNGSS
jgi:hypothetical protein